MKKIIFILLVISQSLLAQEYYCGRFYNESPDYYPNGNPTRAKVEVIKYDVFDKEIDIELIDEFQSEGLKRKCTLSHFYSSQYEYYLCEDQPDFSIPRIVAVMKLKKDQFNRYDKSFKFDLQDAERGHNNLGARITENSKRSFYCKKTL